MSMNFFDYWKKGADVLGNLAKGTNNSKNTASKNNTNTGLSSDDARREKISVKNGTTPEYKENNTNTPAKNTGAASKNPATITSPLGIGAWIGTQFGEQIGELLSQIQKDQKSVGLTTDDAREEKFAVKNNAVPVYNTPNAGVQTPSINSIPAGVAAVVGSLIGNEVAKNQGSKNDNPLIMYDDPIGPQLPKIDNTGLTTENARDEKVSIKNGTIPDYLKPLEQMYEDPIGPQLPTSKIDTSILDSVIGALPEGTLGETKEPIIDNAPIGSNDYTAVAPESFGIDLSSPLGVSPEDYGIDLNGIGFSYDPFQVSDEYNRALDYTNSLLSQLNSGRTSYTSQIEALMNEYKNRDEFSYDMNVDPLFQQMLASSMNSGKTAMQDSVGQAAALTGGYGNTYGQAVGNAAYNQYISDAYGNLPEYYNLALNAYNQEGDKMLAELAMLQDADTAEYNRMYNAYAANRDNVNNMYNREYSKYLDERNAAESAYWDDFNTRYGAYIDAYNQAADERDFQYGAYVDERDFDYNKGQDDKKWEYQYAQDLLGGNTEVEGLNGSEIDRITEAFINNGGATGNGYGAVDQVLSVMGKNNIDNEALMGMLGETRSPLEDYFDVIDIMSNLSPERKEELKKQITEDFARNNRK